MRAATLVARGLVHHRRTHAAVVAGVAAAVAVLAGAGLVGESVRESLRRLALERLGEAHHAVSAPRWLRAGLADDVGRDGVAACMIAVRRGLVEDPDRGRRAAGITVYGVDESFWRFHQRPTPDLTGRAVLVSPALAAELSVSGGASLLLRLDPPSDIPGSLLFGRRDAVARSLRVTVKGTLAAADLGEFSLQPQPQAPRSVFVPLSTLQQALDLPGRANVLLIGKTAQAADLVRDAATLADMGVRLRPLDGGGVAVETESTLLDPELARATVEIAQARGAGATRVLSYLATSIRAGDRSIPYSLVAALDAPWLGETLRPGDGAPVVLNDWAARKLGVSVGDPVTLEYDLWDEPAGRLVASSAAFTLAAVIPIAGPAADRALAPEYPGITDAPHLDDWDPPFPLDLGRIRPRDEDYWERYRTTAKAFVPLEAGQALWRHRLGELTSVRVSDAGAAFDAALRGRLRPAERGLVVEPVRAAALAAASGATDFGQYFGAFSAFLVASALLLAGLFFRLGVEQREREIGLLRAVGFSAARVRALFLAEGAILSAGGAIVGAAGAIAYAQAIVFGLRTLWRGAIGVERLEVHIGIVPLATGAAVGIAIALLTMAAALRAVSRIPPGRLLSGAHAEAPARPSRRALGSGLGLSAAGLALVAAAFPGWVPAPIAFFLSGALLLGAALAFAWRALTIDRRSTGAGVTSVYRLGLRQAARRPGRTLLAGALLAGATFVIVAAGAFRHGGDAPRDRRGSAGGYTLLAESLVPVHHDPSSAEGREALGLTGEEDDVLHGIDIARFRVRPGDDASCLNVYRPQDVRILGATRSFLEQGRFSFQQSLAQTAEERANPWLLLERDSLAGALPAIADANALAYVLHRKLGDELVVAEGVRVRIVGALRSGLLQGELIVSERAFVRAFPEHEAYRFFLIDAAPERAPVVTSFLESRLAQAGFDVTPAAERLARYHGVENTYISVFQMLGGLGLLLGTVGMAAVLLRNALERRRETAVLRAVGYRTRDLMSAALAENLLILVGGLGAGTVAALVAAAPALAARGSRFPLAGMAVLLSVVFIFGVGVLRLAVAAATRGSLLAALRTE